MKRRRVALYGAGHLGRQVWHHLRHHAADELELAGFIDDVQPPGAAVIGGLEVLASLPTAVATPGLDPASLALVFTIGYGDMVGRASALQRVLDAGYALQGFVHPRAVVEPGVELGPGCIVLAGSVLDQGVRVGAACYLDVGVRLTAGTVVGRNNYFSSGLATGSRVVIGDDCFFGMDCTVTTEVRMGSRLFVNAKTLVPRDVADDIKLVELHKSRELPLR